VKSSSNGEPAVPGKRINWTKVLLLVCIAYMLIFGISEYYQRSRDDQEVSKAQSVHQGKIEKVVFPDSPIAGETFQYPVAEDIGDPIPYDPLHSANPAVSEKERERLQEIVRQNNGEIPPEISLE